MALALRKATAFDVIAIAPKLRLADAREIISATGKAPLHILATGLGISIECNVIVKQETDEPIGIYGVSPSGAPPMGIPWMHATPEIEKYPQEIGRHSVEMIERLHCLYPVLGNCADVRNKLHLKWLKWTGFRFLRETKTFAKDGAPFVEFIRIKR